MLSAPELAIISAKAGINAAPLLAPRVNATFKEEEAHSPPVVGGGVLKSWLELLELELLEEESSPMAAI